MSDRLQIVFSRTPNSGASSQYKELKGLIRLVRYASEQGRLIEIGFSTDAPKRKSDYTAAIGPKDFKTLCSMMVAVAPDEAIKAFGAALQEVPEISKPPVSTSPFANRRAREGANPST